MFTQARFIHTSRFVRSNLRTDAVKIFRSALKAVTPQEMVKNTLSLNKTRLLVNKETEYMVYKNVYVVAFGKAVLGMARAVEDILGQNIVQGIASIPCGLQDSIKESGNEEFIQNTLLRTDSPINVIEGAAHNLPDWRAQYAASQIQKVAEKVKEEDLLLVLISGGGSALLPAPVDAITLEEKLQTIKALASSGATINELNTVCKNLSKLKGGKLARIAHPAKVVTLILSDVIGDPLDIIASGPTVFDSSTPRDCLHIISKLHAEEKVPRSVLNFLTEREMNASSEHKDQADFSHVKNFLVGTNRIAVSAAAKEASFLGYTPIIASTLIEGEAQEVGQGFADLANVAATGERILKDAAPPAAKEFLTDNILNELKSAPKPVCVIGAGETTVTLKGKGTGGRNQEMVLSCALTMHKSLKTKTGSLSSSDENIVFLSAGTDGQDGPCSAAGAIAGPGQVTEAITSGIDPQQAIDNNDSYTFYSKFKEGRDHIVTGLTGTNVMDIQVLLVDPKKASK